MSKLLSAGLFRMTRHPLFLAVLLLMPLALGLASGADIELGIDDIFLMPMLFAFGAFVALSWGREHGDGALRNKVVAGHTKTRIFFTEMLLHVGLCAVMMLIFILGTAVTGFSVLTNVPASVLAKVILCLMLSSVGIGVVLSAVCSLINNRAVCAVVGILLVLGLMYGTYWMQDMLNQPQTYTIEFVDENNTVSIEELENIYYIDYPLRSLCVALDKINPFGQVEYALAALSAHTYYFGKDVDDPEWETEKAQRTEALNTLPLFFLVSAVSFSAAGCLLFRRKDMK